MTSSTETVVRERLGLDPAALGLNVVERAVEARMQARGLADPALYAARLLTERAERDALACDLAVLETWFFRGSRELFDRLAAFTATCAAGRTPGNAVRILSVPCGTGEEPYSLAIALHERLLTAEEVIIDAVDLSTRALTNAATAQYGAFAFREPGLDVRPAYFRSLGDRWELVHHLRDAVQFRPGNLTEPDFLAGERRYDLVLCRNLFIYLTPEARLRAVTNIDRLLAADGLLCVTPGEADRLPPGQFTPEGPIGFGLYRRAGVTAGPPPIRAMRVPPVVEHPLRVAHAVPTPQPVASPARTLPTLAAARRLADAGRLAEARVACEELLSARSADADALALLGVIHLAAGDDTAAFDALRKALYLAPDHPEAVPHMLGLCDRRGEKARAAALRRRLALARLEDGA